MKTIDQNYYGPQALIEKEGEVESFKGLHVHRLNSLKELQDFQSQTKEDVVFINPFRSIHERGDEYKARGDEPILALEVQEQASKSREALIGLFKSLPIELASGPTPNTPDDIFAHQVSRLQADAIYGGHASQVILSRVFEGRIDGMSLDKAKALYKKLLNQRGQYMTLFFSDGGNRYFIGASPERHLEVAGDQVIMNPIAGTFRKGDQRTFKEDFSRFLKDPKEVNELYQVLDEELKMMARVCPKGGKIIGPELRETSSVIHTEYKLIGQRNGMHSIDALRHTLHAPTLVGSPLASASRLIYDYEGRSRRYYGGQMGVLRKNGDLDTAILIRTAEIGHRGDFRVQAGAGIVRDSDPRSETLETTAKANAFLNILKSDHASSEPYLKSGDFQEILQERNRLLSKFHFENQAGLTEVPELKGLKIRILHNEDDFSYMIDHMTRHMGCDSHVLDGPTTEDILEADVVIVGPGPGDINDEHDPKMARLNARVRTLMDLKKPMLGVCLGHQAIAKAMGMPVVKQVIPTQGVQRTVDLFGKMESLGFYNSFSPYSFNAPLDLKMSFDDDGRVIAMKKKGLIGCQFHPESVMSENGYEILKQFLLELKRGI